VEGYKSFEFPSHTSKFVTPEFIEECKKTMPELTYMQEIEAHFIEGEGEVFKNIKSCIEGELQEPKQQYSYTMGLDLARLHDFTVITIMNNSTNHVDYFERFNTIDWTLQCKRVKAVYDRYFQPQVVMDSTGLGDPVYEMLQKEGISSIHPYKYNAQTKKALIDKLSIDLQYRKITFPNIPELISELESFSYEVSPSGNITYDAPEGLFDDCVNSLALANIFLEKNKYIPFDLWKEAPKKDYLPI
jgi:phage FluMu gp28-like protein